MRAELWIAMAGMAIGLPLVFLYNRLVAERNLVRQGFADIDVQLKRRADLVPSLVEAVRGYAAYEKAVLTAVTEVRAAAVAAPDAEARFTQERVLGEHLKQLLLLQESYPELKADQNFRDLSARLVEIEDHLQFARRFYNGAVKEYVTRLESFPTGLIGRLFGFKPMPFFATTDREVIAVDL
jgi:LemA protein